MSHEVSHVLLRHVNQKVSASLTWKLFLGSFLIFIDVSVAEAFIMYELKDLFDLKYSRGMIISKNK